MELSVETYCNLLARSSLLTPQEVKTVHGRWLAEAREHAGQADHFAKWLIARHFITEYQAKLIARGQVDNFFLGQYKLVERIGQGRMAGIYKGVHRLGQTVAIKVLPPSKAKIPELFTRFQREARMAQQLRHPNVVRAFQMAESGGVFYIVMEFLEGETLEDYLKRRPKMPPVEAVRLIYQALQGLQHIHEKQLVHRDLKPANLMLVPTPDASTAHATIKILDIGLGKVMFDEGDDDGQAQLTVDGTMLGSPLYMAPEQARSAHSADIRADIYSLGCVLYHCLTGQPPFQENNVVKLMLKHAQEPPRPIRDFNLAVPEGLQHMVMWMLAKEPGQRFPTPERAAASLQTYLAAPEVLRPLDAEPRMAAYLKWLAEEDDPPARPAPGPAHAPAPAPAATPGRATAPIPARPTTPVRAVATPALVTARSIPTNKPRQTPLQPPEEESFGADVELVTPPGRARLATEMAPASGGGYLLMALGGLAVILLVVVLAFLIYRLADL